MKTRFAAIAVLAVFVVLTSSAAMSASDSDALTDPYVLTTNPETEVDPYALYYYNQLTTEQLVIYHAMEAVDTNPVLNGSEYEYTFPIDLTEPDHIQAREDVITAWNALRLDNVYALVTWTNGLPTPSLYTEYIDGKLASFTITMDPMFSDAVALRDQIKTKVDAMEVKGTDVPGMVKSINSILTGKDFKFSDEGASGVYGIAGDAPYELSPFGFSVMVKALCFKNGIDMNCMQVYGTLADGSKNLLHAWNIIMVDYGQVYAMDTAICKKTGDNAWMLAGRYTSCDGDSFGKAHLAFAFNTGTIDNCDFESELLCNDGYDWPTDGPTILDKLEDNAPWILIGVICVVLAVYLLITARKGGNL